MNNELRIKNARRSNEGFTLIETLMYSAIITMIAVFAILAVYQMISSSDRLYYERQTVENIKFVEQKIRWALQNVSAINAPAAGATTTQLSVSKIGYGQNPVIIDWDSDIIRLQQGAGAAQSITNNYVRVQELYFHQFNFSGQPVIKVFGVLVDNYASTSLNLDTIIYFQ